MMPRLGWWPIFFLIALNIFFFSQFWVKGLLPFPGDLLLAEYGPFKNSSFLGFSPGAIPNKAQSFDTLRQLYPWRYLGMETLRSGQWPLWNPYNFCGAPLLANFQSAIFNPLNILFFILPFYLAWSIQVMAQPLLASLFFYFFVRNIKISLSGALIGAIAWGYSSFMVVWLEYNTIGHVILWLPLALLAVNLMAKKFSFTSGSLLVFSLAMSAFAGHIQDFAVVFVFVQAYLFYLFIIEKKFKFFGWLKVFLVGHLVFIICAIQMLPGLELILNSARTPLDHNQLMNSVLLTPWQLIVAFIPDFFGNPANRNYFLPGTYIGKVLYVGLIPLLLALVSLVKFEERKVGFFASAAGVCLALSLASPITSFIYRLPLFSSLSPTRISLVYQFGLAVLACFGYESLLNKFFLKKLFPLLAVVAIFLVALLAASGQFVFVGESFLEHINVVRRNTLYSGAIFTVSLILVLAMGFKKSSAKRVLPIAMILFLVFDLFRFFYKITPFAPKDSFFPETEVAGFLSDRGLDRYWGYGTATISTNYNLLLGVFSAEGYDPLYPKKYGQFIQSSVDGKIGKAVRSDASFPSGFGPNDFSQNIFRQRVLELTSSRYILDRTENLSDIGTFPPSQYDLIWSQDDWRIFESKNSTPRFFLPNKLFGVATKDELQELLFARDFDPKTQIGVISDRVGQQTFPSGNIELVDYQPNYLKLRSDTKQTQPLVVTDTYYPGWQAYIDGESVPLFAVNYTFRMTQVPSGNHLVEFIYNPVSFKLGLYLSGFFCCGWLILAIFTIINKVRRKYLITRPE